jgi:hypothetical protein
MRDINTHSTLVCIAVLVTCSSWLAAQSYAPLSSSRQQSESSVSYALLKHRESGHNNTATHDYTATDDPYLALDPRELQQYWSEPHENYRAELDSLQFLLAHLGHVTVHVVLLGNYPPSLAVRVAAKYRPRTHPFVTATHPPATGAHGALALYGNYHPRSTYHTLIHTPA